MIVIMSLQSLITELNPLTIRASSGELLFARDDPVRSLFVVKAGLIHLVRHQADGTPTVMQRAGPGHIVAEASLFATHYHCDAVVMEEAELRCIQIGPVRDRMASDPEFATAIAQHLAREVHRMRVRSEILGMKTVAARLQTWLSLNDGLLPDKGQWRGVANDIGVSPEALYRELSSRRKR